jgi:UDP:flavonoid glycosyltransferase YjiC (YdhE family)
MHEVATRFADGVAGPLGELERLTGLDRGRLATALASETVLSLVPDPLDRAAGALSPQVDRFHRFRAASGAARTPPLPDWGDPTAPLVYVTFGSVTGSLPPFAGVFRAALDALAAVPDVRVLMTVGHKVEVAGLGPLPANALVVPWWPQASVLPHASAVLGHGGFGTTLGALTAGVPQVVAPLFSFDQVVNGTHVAAVGAGLTTDIGPDVVERAAARIPQVLGDPAYATSARAMAAAIRTMPPAADALPLLVDLTG